MSRPTAEVLRAQVPDMVWQVAAPPSGARSLSDEEHAELLRDAERQRDDLRRLAGRLDAGPARPDTSYRG
ncbi:hypothetical protein ABGB07_04090 [Micromonosporaceae bacterium B7E4]